MAMRGADVSRAASAPVGADLVVQGPYVLREDLEVLQLLTGAVGVEPLGRAQCDAYRLHEPADVAGVPQACGAAGYDWASFGGAGVSGEFPGPWSTLVRLDAGVPVVGRNRGQRGFSLNLVFLKIF